MQAESHESTTAYGLQFLEAIRRTSDKRYVDVGPIMDAIIVPFLSAAFTCSSAQMPILTMPLIFPLPHDSIHLSFSP